LQDDAPSTLYFPAEQSKHAEEDVLPLTALYLPAAHETQEAGALA
jgi:hypothetical protein